MAELLFLPHYAEVLEQVVRDAEARGALDVSCRPDVDPAVVAGQLHHYAAATGRPLRCQVQGDRVAVRSPRRRRVTERAG